jgi:hypothetical protein
MEDELAANAPKLGPQGRPQEEGDAEEAVATAAVDKGTRRDAVPPPQKAEVSFWLRIEWVRGGKSAARGSEAHRWRGDSSGLGRSQSAHQLPAEMLCSSAAFEGETCGRAGAFCQWRRRRRLGGTRRDGGAAAGRAARAAAAGQLKHRRRSRVARTAGREAVQHRKRSHSHARQRELLRCSDAARTVSLFTPLDVSPSHRFDAHGDAIGRVERGEGLLDTIDLE